MPEINLEKIQATLENKAEKSESVSEQSFEKEKQSLEQKTNQAEQLKINSSAVATPSVSNSNISYEDRRIQAIEEIMSAGLDQAFLKMSPKEQKKFKEEGEKTAKKINILFKKAKLEANKVIKLISRWLQLIPGVNRFFLEQEAKIKSDKIIKIKNNL